MSNDPQGDSVAFFFISYIIAFILIGYYVKDCVNIEIQDEEYCHKMFIATMFFSVVDLIPIAWGLIFCLTNCLCSVNDEGILYSIVFCIDMKKCFGTNLQVFISEFCCLGSCISGRDSEKEIPCAEII